MSAVKHTPGPWAATSSHATKTSNFGGYHCRVEARPVAGASFGVCKTYSDDKHVALANARLIAETPAMEELLRSVLADASGSGSKGDGDAYAEIEWDDVERIRAILARIDG